MIAHIEYAAERILIPGTAITSVLIGTKRYPDVSGYVILKKCHALRDRVNKPEDGHLAMRIEVFDETSIGYNPEDLNWPREFAASEAILTMVCLDYSKMDRGSPNWKQHMSLRVDQQLVSVAKRKDVRALILDQTHFHSSSLQHALGGIKYLVINESELADEDLEEGTRCTIHTFGQNQSLTDVFLHGTSFATPVLKALAHHVALQRLDVSLPDDACAQALQQLLCGKPPRLVELTIACTEFTESITHHVMNGLQKAGLQNLRFDSCTWDTSLEPSVVRRLQILFFARMFDQCPQCWFTSVLIRGDTDFDKHKLALDYFDRSEELAKIITSGPVSLVPAFLARAQKQSARNSTVYWALKHSPHVLAKAMLGEKVV